MALTKQDKQDIQEIVTDVVSDAVNELAGVTAKGFAAVDGQFKEVHQQLKQFEQFAPIRRDIADIKYILSDVVHRSEFLNLKARVDQLEQG